MGILRTDKISGLEKEKGQNPNLVANGDFSEASTAGWKGYNAVVSYDSGGGGRIKVDDSAGAGGWSNAAYVVETEPGASYRFEVNATAADSDTHYIGYYQGTYDTAGTTPTVYSSEITATPSLRSFDLVATGSTVTILLIANNNGVVYFDNVSFRKTDGNPIGGSVHFDGTGDYLDLTLPAFGNSDLTFELWFWADTFAAWNTLFEYGNHTSSSNGIIVSLKGSGVFARNGSTDISNATITTPYQIPQGAWNHLALTREGTTARLHINGVFVGSATWSKVFTETNLRIGGPRYLSGEFYTDYISNFRVLKGTALYNESNFTPPVHALEVIKDTIILCCNNPDSATAIEYEEIGVSRTITAAGNAVASTFSPSLTRDFTSGTEFNGVTTFDTQGFFVVPSGTTEQRDKSGGRGIIAGTDNGIQYITISSFGNSQDFGDLTYSAPYAAGCASHTRGLIAGGYNAPTGNNTINAITISTTGNAINFGDIPQTVVYGMGGCSSSTRGLFAGGFKAPSPNAEAGLQQINYVTIASLGDAQDFGDLTNGVRYPAGTSSPTRAIFAGGRDTPSGNKNIISYVTIASTGNATDFGDLTVALYSMGGTGSATRGLFTGGYNPAGSPQDTMDYLTIASTGNAQDFGNLSLARGGVAASSNPTRATFAGGSNPSAQNVIDYVEIQSTGDAKNFGDLYSTRYAAAGFSNSHGGLS